MIFVDLETRSRCDLKVEGGHRYAADPSTEILCGIALDTRTDPAEVWLWTPYEYNKPLGSRWHVPAATLEQLQTPHDAVRYMPPEHGRSAPPQVILDAAANGVAMVAHNAMGFEKPVWEAKGWGPVAFLDSLPRARRVSLPGRLDTIGQRVYETRKDKTGRRMMELLCKPSKKGKFIEPTVAQMGALARYCALDVFLLAAVWLDEGLGEEHPDDEVLRTHHLIDARGAFVDQSLARKISRMDQHEVAVAQEVARSYGVKSKTLNSSGGLVAWLKGRGVEVADVTGPTVKGLLTDPDLDIVVRDVLEARQAVARVTGGKAMAILNTVCSDGRLRGSLAYWGAHTGRWSGRGFQPQNLPRAVKGLDEKVFDHPEYISDEVARLDRDVGDIIGAMLRGCIRAETGLLAAMDFSQIEARGLLWLAGDTEGLDQFVAGDPYKNLATKIFDCGIDDVSPDQRTASKVCILACGYQGGPTTLAAFAKNYGLDVEGLGLDLDTLVEGWRDANLAVSGEPYGKWKTPEGRMVTLRRGGLWRDLYAAAINAIGEGKVDGPREAGKCVFRLEHGHLYCRLPSGRDILYRDPRVEEVDTLWGGRKKALTYAHPHGGRRALYGGRICENVVQAVCRDLLAEALVRLEKSGLNPVLHVHDEIIAEVRDHREADEAARLMAFTPLWAQDFPVDVESHVGVRYSK